jgi:hypothetical protein
VLLPLSGDGATIDHVLGAASYRSLRSKEALSTQVHFRRLPICAAAKNRRHETAGVKTEPRPPMTLGDAVPTPLSLMNRARVRRWYAREEVMGLPI